MGKIILLNTAIGNPEDLSSKARHCLETGCRFAVEDTRKFKGLLARLGISPKGKKILSFHDHSPKNRAQNILAQLEEGDVYVASDAGSPVIADPAFPLIRLALEQNLEVDSVSGVSSVLYALEVSGLPPYPFTFWGFLPRRDSKRASLMENLAHGTHIFFEAGRRICDSVGELVALYPNARIVLAKELSKTHQGIERFAGRDWETIKGPLDVRGEFVILIHLERRGQGKGKRGAFPPKRPDDERLKGENGEEKDSGRDVRDRDHADELV
ncbi:MAG: SAM-dependent methyltransferase [Bacteriovoracales bacterium]|nr:SAM-dependent methyltransferase [Bacteriovoracales bacterium]